jgi:hypothetical protein
MALTPPPNNLMPNLMPFRVGRPYLAISCAAPLTMDVLQRSLGNRLLNASRIPVDEFRLQGLQDGDTVFLEGERKPPKTGNPYLDRLAEKSLDMMEYIPQATEDATSNGLKWGLVVGTGVTAATALGLLLLKRQKMLEESSRALKVMIPLGFGAVASAVTSVGAFLYSFLQNFLDFHRHQAKTTLKSALKTVPTPPLPRKPS